jgi:hypothetical protein
MIPPTGGFQVSPRHVQESTAAIKPWHCLRIASEPGSQAPEGAYFIQRLFPLNINHLRALLLPRLRHPKSARTIAATKSLGILQLGNDLGHCGHIVEIR